ncbi:anthrax toxin receptor-like isoform X2 [Fukomys damarensis]|uniref:anthrax toxin receptor-like isoform X2 n=1 Tax=Fukomys damarensis TaxID=885580 RepID=UPI0008FEBA67|nr:anthrax toxin receptor-like isoform X2 [Fukomys damarensis]
MGRHSPCVPYSALFLLLLLLLPAQLSRAQSSGWRASHPHYPNSAHFYNYRVRQARQNVNQVDDVLQYCDGAFDVYYLLDSSNSVSNWPSLSSSWEDLVEKYVNPNLRMSFIVFNTRSRIELMLTSNRTAIYHRLVALENIPTSGEIYLQKAFRQANEQIARANSGAKRVSSMIIAVVSGPLRLDVFNETMIEARTARTMGAYIYLIGVDNYSTFQLKAIADSPEHVFGIHGALRNLHGRVDYIGTRACLELRYVEPSPLCPAKQVVLKGYGFHNARSRNQVICRFKFSNNVAIDEHPIRMNMTTITCPTPQAVQPGQNITVEVSLNNGRDFLARSIRVEATADCNRAPITTTKRPRTRPPPTTTTTTTTMATTTTTTRTPTPTTTTTTTTTPLKTTPTTPQPTSPTSPTSSAPPQPTDPAPVIPLPAVITVAQTTPALGTRPPQTMPSKTLLGISAVMGLLMIILVLCWVWWLCCRRPEKEPPPRPRPKKRPRVKKPAPLASPLPPPPPPPAPAPALPPITVCPTIIVCCCACRGVCVNRSPEGTMILCNFSHPSCHQVPLIWSQLSDQGSCTNFDLLKTLCAQGPLASQICLHPSQDSLPLAYCSQCHHPEAWSTRSPSRMLPLLYPPSRTACRPALSLPPP